MLGVMDGVLAYYSGRDLPPVDFPNYTGIMDSGIFDLLGRPVVLNPDADDESSESEIEISDFEY